MSECWSRQRDIEGELSPTTKLARLKHSGLPRGKGLLLSQALGEFELTDSSDVIARNFVALEDALGLHLLAHNSSMTLKHAERQLASYARSATGAQITPTAPAASPAVPSNS